MKSSEKVRTVILYTFMGILLLLASIFMGVFIYTFYGRNIPVSLEKWNYFSMVLSGVSSMLNLALFVFLTIKAYNLEVEYSRRQDKVSRINIITEHRIRKLSDLDKCVNYVYLIYTMEEIRDIASNLGKLRISFLLFFSSSKHLFPEFSDFNHNTKIVDKIVEIEDAIGASYDGGKSVLAKQEKFINDMNELNELMISYHTRLWDYTYNALESMLSDKVNTK